MSSAIEGALKTLFTGDATLMSTVEAVYNSVAPVGAPYPHIIFQSLGGPLDYTLTQKIRTSFTYDIRVVDKSESLVKINTAVARIYALLTDAELVAGQTLYCRCVGVIPNYPAQDDDGKVLMQGGATYSIQVR